MKKSIFIIAVAAIAVSCGNKQSAPQAESDSTVVATDSVAQVDSQAEKQSEIDAVVTEKIKEFYKLYVFGNEEATDEVINQYCTKKLAKKLADDYEYEGGGYAIWDFRSGNQDGDSDVQTAEKIEPIGDGKYKVYYNDMGTKGTCIISVIVKTEDLKFVDAEDVLFDDISSK